MVQNKPLRLSLSLFLDVIVLCIVFGFAAGIAKAQTTTCPGVLSISASLGGCDDVFVGWTHVGPLAVSSQSLVYGDGFRPSIDLSARSYRRSNVGCSYHTAVTVTQTYANNQTCVAYYNDNHNRQCSDVACAGSASVPLTILNALNYRSSSTSDSIAVAFGENLTTVTAAAIAKPLPFSLGGLQVWVDDVQAGLFFASPLQVNFYVPPGLSVGLKNVRITNAEGKTFTGQIYLAVQAPGVGTKDGTGGGAAAADYGNGYLALFATGINYNLLTKADITLHTSAGDYPCQYVGPTGNALVGLVQLNFLNVPINGQGAELRVAGFVSQGFDLRR